MRSGFEIELLPEAVDFLEKIDKKAREKIYYNMRKSQYIKDEELFKKLNDRIWEFRTLFNSASYRLFAFWDRSGETETLIVATHGILKKTNKTPWKEIQKAEEIRRQYFIKKKNQ